MAGVGMISLTFQPQVNAKTRTANMARIGFPASKEVHLGDLQCMKDYWSMCASQAHAETGQLRKHTLRQLAGGLDVLVLERFVQVVVGESAVEEMNTELSEYHASVANVPSTHYALADFEQPENAVSCDRRVVAFRRFPTLLKLRGVLACWLQQDNPLVADATHWDPAGTMRAPELESPMQGFLAGVRLGATTTGMALPPLLLETFSASTELDLNPGDVYFLSSTQLERRGQQAPSSEEEDAYDAAKEHERARVDKAIKKGKKIVRTSQFLRR